MNRTYHTLAVQAAVLMLIISVCTGCGGTMLGNPKNPDETTSRPRAVLPVVRLNLPQKILTQKSSQPSALKLSDTGQTSCNNLLHCMAKRSDYIVEDINDSLKFLDPRINIETRVTSFLDADGALISGRIKAVSNNPLYATEGVFCKDNEIFLHLKWNQSQSRVHLIFDQAVWSVDRDHFAGITEIIYDRTSREKLSIYSQGRTELRSELERTGEYLTELFSTETDQNGKVTASGFNDWDADRDDQNPEYDGYLVSNFDHEGDGEFLQYYSEENEYCSEEDQARFEPDFAEEIFLRLQEHEDFPGDEDPYFYPEEDEDPFFDDPDFENDEHIHEDFLESHDEHISWCSANQIGIEQELADDEEKLVEERFKKAPLINRQKLKNIGFSPNLTCY